MTNLFSLCKPVQTQCGAMSIFILLLLSSHWGGLALEDSCIAKGCNLDLPFIRLGAAPLKIPVTIRGRDSIPHSHLPFMPKKMTPANREYPAIFRYEGDGNSTVGNDLGSFIRDHLHGFAAVVLKGLPVNSSTQFSHLMHATGLDLQDYIGGVTSRPLAAPKVTPASAEPPEVSMESHCDNPYWARPPLRLVLFCKLPPRVGGQAFLTDGRAVLRQLWEEHPDIVKALQSRQMRYYHFYPDADTFEGSGLVTWQESYAAGCNATQGCDLFSTAMEALLRENHSFEWIPSGLRRWEVVPAIKAHPVTGEETWTNQLTAMHCSVFDNHPGFPELHRSETARAEACRMHGSMPYHTTFGDGEEFPSSLVNAVRAAQWAHSVTFDFEAGDVMLVDNYLSMHGRISFEEPREMFITLVG